MSILASQQITALCEEGMVTPFDAHLVNPASLDIRVGDSALIEVDGFGWQPVSLASSSRQRPYLIAPKEFLLVATLERFYLPEDIAAEFMLKSSRAREGYGHSKAGFCDPGWHDSVLTMELHNHSRYRVQPLYPGMLIGQMVFHRMDVTPHISYAQTGRYNGDHNVKGSKMS